MFKTKIFVLSLTIISIFLFTSAQAAIYIYKDNNGKMHLANQLRNEADNLYIDNFDKYQPVMISSAELEELKKKKKLMAEEEETNEDRYDKELLEVTKELNADFYLLKSIIKAMSNFKVDYNKDGYIGLMGVKKNWTKDKDIDLEDPKTNIELGAKKILEYLEEFDYDINLALAAYFLSPKEVHNELENSGDLPRNNKCRKFIMTVKTTQKVYSEEVVSTIKKQVSASKDKILLYNVQKK